MLMKKQTIIVEGGRIPADLQNPADNARVGAFDQ
jgi:hypothetical protein